MLINWVSSILVLLRLKVHILFLILSQVCSQPLFRTVIVAFVAWVGLYWALILKWPGIRQHEWHCRIVTTVHAVVIITLSAWCVFIQGPWPFTKPGLNSTLFLRLQWSLAMTWDVKYWAMAAEMLKMNYLPFYYYWYLLCPRLKG